MNLRGKERFHMMLLKKNKAQSILEYAIMFACIAAALLVMQVYIKRGVQGKLRQAGDSFGQQYDPKNTTSTNTMTYKSTTTTIVNTKSETDLKLDIDDDGNIKDDVFATETESILDNESTTQTGNEKVGPIGNNLYEDTTGCK